MSCNGMNCNCVTCLSRDQWMRAAMRLDEGQFDTPRLNEDIWRTRAERAEQERSMWKLRAEMKADALNAATREWALWCDRATAAEKALEAQDEELRWWRERTEYAERERDNARIALEAERAWAKSVQRAKRDPVIGDILEVRLAGVESPWTAAPVTHVGPMNGGGGDFFVDSGTGWTGCAWGMFSDEGRFWRWPEKRTESAGG